jgi:predicted porin
MNQDEMAAFAATRVDTAVQLVMPFGPATPNRAGIQSDLTVDVLDGNIEAQATYAALENATGAKIDSVRALPATKFTQASGGLKLEAGGLMGISPLTLAGSFMRSTANNDGLAGDTLHAAAKVTSDFINAGAQWNFWKRFSVLGGWQQITTTVDRGAKEAKQVQTHTAGGVDYKVSAGAHLLLSVGRIKVDEPPPAAGGDRDFSQLITDLFLTVHF